MKIAVGVTVEMVKAEAARRIEARYPLWRQVNIDRVGGADKETMGAFIDSVRAASNEIEAMSPIPPDYAADRRWPDTLD